MMYMPILIKRGNMNTFFCIMIFIMGTFFGSFFTLAVYRLPLKKDITHERSFCPKCNHRLEALDMIPIFSYIFLGGKCRYCKEPIRPRYLILEILSGIVFLVGYLSFKMNYPFFTLIQVLALVNFIFMYVTTAIILGIDKENRKLQKNVLVFGFIMELLYILYLYIVVKPTNMYRYGIYMMVYGLFVLILSFLIRKKNKYVSDFFLFSLYVLIFIQDIKYFLSILGVTGFVILIQKIIKKEKIPYIFYLGIVTIMVTILKNFIMYY